MSQQFKLKNLIPPAFNRKNGRETRTQSIVIKQNERKKALGELSMKKINLIKFFTPVIPPQHYLRFPIYSSGSRFFFFIPSNIYLFLFHIIYTFIFVPGSHLPSSLTRIYIYTYINTIYDKPYTAPYNTNSHYGMQ